MNNYGTCKENCAYYSTGYSKVYDCYMNQFCAQQRRCNGKVLNCEYIDSDMWICPSVRRSILLTKNKRRSNVHVIFLVPFLSYRFSFSIVCANSI